MEVTLKHIEQYLDLGRTCYKLTYKLNDSTMILYYCKGYYFKIEHLVQQLKKLIDKAKKVAETKGFETIQLYLPQNISTDEILFYKENGFEFYPKSSVKMYYKLTNKKQISMAEQKPTPNEVKNDLIKLLKIMPSVSLAQNQPLSELLYELRKKYNVPTHESERLTNKNK